MRFGGHETFPIREGWLHKGLRLLTEEPDHLLDEYSADWLGVGRNMAKAIRHWLVATGLAEPALLTGKGGLVPPEPSDLGRSVWKGDPYFLEPGTWWAIHINLVNSKQFAYTWWWFFNHFQLPRFDRGICVDGLLSQLRLVERRVPSHTTLQRDVGCLLASYGRAVPPEAADPEDAAECPLGELDLLTYFRASGTYRINTEAKPIDPEIFGYAVARAFPARPHGQSKTEITLREAATETGGPGRAFVLNEEGIFDLAVRYEGSASSGLSLAGLAGERLIRLPSVPAVEWLDRYYKRVGARTNAA